MTAVVVMTMNYELPKRAFSLSHSVELCVSYNDALEGSHIYQFCTANQQTFSVPISHSIPTPCGSWSDIRSTRAELVMRKSAYCRGRHCWSFIHLKFSSIQSKACWWPPIRWSYTNNQTEHVTYTVWIRKRGEIFLITTLRKWVCKWGIWGIISRLKGKE